MKKTDQMELKKQLTIKKHCISRIAGCYVNTSKKIQCKFAQNFLTLDEEEIFKYLELIKKVFGCKVDDTLQSLSITEEDNKKLLNGLLSSELKQEALIDTFYQNIIKSYNHADEFCVFLFLSNYDVPNKGSDKLYQNESDEVYSAIYGMVCPMEISKPGLSYHVDENKIANRTRDKVIAAPTLGFIFPDFEERTTEPDKIVYAMCDKKDGHPEFAEEILGCKKRMTAKEQKEAFTQALSEVISKADIETVSAINDELVEIVEEAKEENIVPAVTPDKVKDILVKNGIEVHKAENFVSTYKDSVPDKEQTIRLDNVTETKKKVYKTPDITINVAPEKRHLVKTETREGKEYIVISLESEVEINGIISTPK